MFGRERQRRDDTGDSHGDRVAHWRRHDMLFRLAYPRDGEVLVIDDRTAMSLRRDGFIAETGSYSGCWDITPSGTAQLARWGQSGPGRFPG